MIIKRNPYRHPADPHGVLRVPLTQGKEAFISEESEPLIAGRNWYASLWGHVWYASSKILIEGKSMHMLMHRHIFSLSWGDKRDVDHIDYDGLNNTLGNIRVVTRRQNATRKRPIGNNAFKGISFDKRRRKWIAYISPGGPRRVLGAFMDPVEAALAYDAAAKMEYGDFAYLNFPAHRIAP